MSSVYKQLADAIKTNSSQAVALAQQLTGKPVRALKLSIKHNQKEVFDLLWPKCPEEHKIELLFLSMRHGRAAMKNIVIKDIDLSVHYEDVSEKSVEYNDPDTLNKVLPYCPLNIGDDYLRAAAAFGYEEIFHILLPFCDPSEKSQALLQALINEHETIARVLYPLSDIDLVTRQAAAMKDIFQEEWGYNLLMQIKAEEEKAHIESNITQTQSTRVGRKI